MTNRKSKKPRATRSAMTGRYVTPAAGKRAVRETRIVESKMKRELEKLLEQRLKERDAVPTMKKAAPQLDTRADDVETGLDQVSPATHAGRSAESFRRIVQAQQLIAAAEAELDAAVTQARDAGDSWTVIGAALGVTRQAAFQRFGRIKDSDLPAI